MEYLTEIKVRGYHVDSYGHVNNARYLEFLEENRWALLESNIDLEKWTKQGIFFLVVNININYRREAVVDDILVISVDLEKIGNRSAVLQQKIFLKDSDVIVADALITFVIADKSGKVLSMDGEIFKEIEKLRLSSPK